MPQIRSCYILIRSTITNSTRLDVYSNNCESTPLLDFQFCSTLKEES